MLREHIPDYETAQREITASNVKFYSYYGFDDWVNLTGLQLPIFPENFAPKKDFVLHGTYPSFTLFIKNDNVWLDIKFNLFDKSIYVTWFILTETRRRYGRKMLEHFIKVANKMGFLILRCQADSERIVEGKRLNGSQAWGRMGFIMSYRSHCDFLKIMRENNREEKCLQHLLFSEEGIDFWNAKILKWRAVFDLRENSKNRRLLKLLNDFMGL